VDGVTPASSNFVALVAEWPDAHEAATRAEALAHADARTACFHARRALELIVRWLYRCEAKLRLPYQDNLSALIHEPTFKEVAGEAVFNKARVIVTLGNRAVHSHRLIPTSDALVAVRELFHIGYWLARTYTRGAKPAAGLAFDPDALPKTTPLPPQTLEQLQRLEAQLRERDEKLSTLLADKTALDAELTRLRGEVAAVKKSNAATPDTHDYSEAETRDYFIDLLLKEAAWALAEKRDREFEVTGMPNTPGKGYVDYVLWGDDGKPLALVEAKRTRKSAPVGQQQAKLYADCLEKQFGRRPVIFHSNGYAHWLWDDAGYPPRPVQGFLKKAELELLIQRRTTRRPLAAGKINEAIVERYYQTRAIRRIAEAFEKDHDRKTLVVMATGAGKTRTVIALCDLLMRCNWAKRVLFLADRVALVNQAVNAFKKHLPESSPVNLVTEKDAEGRVFVSTYPTMMGLIDETHEGQRRFGVGHFDLIIIDEAHRSVYQKYGAIFRYFDALLVGLTATPRDEIDRDTYGLFELEKGVPTDAYDLADAVADKFLVPARAVSVPLKFQREGIRYDDLSDEEKAQWDEAEWDEESGGAGARGPGGGEQVALQRADGGHGARAPHDARAESRRRRPTGKDDHLCQEPEARGVHRGAVRRQLPAPQGRVCARGPLRPAVCAVADRRLLGHRQGAAHRDLRRYARYRHRRAGGRQSRLLQAGAVEDEILADGRARHAAVPGPVRAGKAQGILQHLRFLPEPGILPGEPRGHGRLARRFAGPPALQGASRNHRRARFRRTWPASRRRDGRSRTRPGNPRAAAHGSRGDERGELHRAAAAPARGKICPRRGVDGARCGRPR
jgi:hypothetical protein